jgi:acyl-CoA synthetase (AMP-forming)/AMP-acid ligase II
MLTKPKTLLESLLAACGRAPEKTVYTALGDGESESDKRNFGELLVRVNGVAASLRDRQLQGKTVLLFARDSLRFIETFLGCLWAGAIPVPVAIPRQTQSNGFLQAICANAHVSAAIAELDDIDRLSLLLSHSLAHESWISIDQLAANPTSPGGPQALPDDTAFLQYTSGSTGHPKGVVVTHANLMANQRALRCALQTNRDTIYVSWLPLYHDMGLIGHALPAIYLAASCVIMPPTAFLQKPIRWLRAISQYHGTHSGGPNFAYELCLQRVSAEARVGLDLESWEAAFNGGEPIRADTIKRFCKTFESSGFKREAMYPCYGLAESTLVVTGNTKGTGPRYMQVSKQQLENGRASPAVSGSTEETTELVSSGEAVLGAQLRVVDSLTHAPVDDGSIGEIWVSGDSVTAGYFQDMRERTRSAACVTGTSRLDFLRTGDVGFLWDGQLYVTGRLKDIIIIRGRNHYPQDLEATASRCNSMIAPGLAAALTFDKSDEASELCVICELTRQGWSRAILSEVVADVRQAISTEHGLAVQRVILIRPGSLPRTSSGKVRRSACREMIRAGQFDSSENLLVPRARGDVPVAAFRSKSDET